MARTAKKRENAPLPPEPEPVFRICGTCRHWRPRPNWPVSGECMPSRAGNPQALVSLDWAGCSAWASKDGA